MVLMTHMAAGAALRALLDRARGEPTCTSDVQPQLPASSAAREVSSNRDALSSTAPPAACDSETAADDFAALREGNLSPTGVARLSDHVAQCESCQILVAFMIREAHSVEASDIIWTDPARRR